MGGSVRGIELSEEEGGRGGRRHTDRQAPGGREALYLDGWVERALPPKHSGPLGQ